MFSEASRNAAGKPAHSWDMSADFRISPAKLAKFGISELTCTSPAAPSGPRDPNCDLGLLNWGFHGGTVKN